MGRVGLPLYSTAVLILYALDLLFTSIRSLLYFLYRQKVPKSLAQTKIVVYSFCSWVALQHHSAVINLPLQSFLFRAGCYGTRSTRLFKKNYTRVTLKQPRTMACSQQGFTFYFWQCRFFWHYSCRWKAAAKGDFQTGWHYQKSQLELFGFTEESEDCSQCGALYYSL